MRNTDLKKVSDQKEHDQVLGDEQREEQKADDIQTIMETMHLSLEQAMDTLKIPQNKRKAYSEMLNLNYSPQSGE